MKQGEVFEYLMDDDFDIVFIKCDLEQKSDAPFVFVVAKEPDKNLRIIPFCNTEKFHDFVKNFVNLYYPKNMSLLNILYNTIVIDDLDKEYRVVCDGKVVSFRANTDPLSRRAYISRSDIEDYPNNQNGI